MPSEQPNRHSPRCGCKCCWLCAGYPYGVVIKRESDTSFGCLNCSTLSGTFLTSTAIWDNLTAETEQSQGVTPRCTAHWGFGFLPTHPHFTGFQDRCCDGEEADAVNYYRRLPKLLMVVTLTLSRRNVATVKLSVGYTRGGVWVRKDAPSIHPSADDYCDCFNEVISGVDCEPAAGWLPADFPTFTEEVEFEGAVDCGASGEVVLEDRKEIVTPSSIGNPDRWARTVNPILCTDNLNAWTVSILMP